jgi:2-polyprenyl-6-methoxyphenol hydroxylase-like FAD-dependent oxidoreductase
MAKFVENMNLQKALLTNVQKHNNVEIIDKTKVQDITQGDLKSQGGWPIVKLENGRSIRARLLVGADGFNSPVKNYSGIKTDGWAYDAHCLVGTLELEPSPLDTNTIAWQRFLPVGPLGFLPVCISRFARMISHLCPVTNKCFADRRQIWFPCLVNQTTYRCRSEKAGCRTLDGTGKCFIPPTLVIIILAIPTARNLASNAS